MPPGKRRRVGHEHGMGHAVVDQLVDLEEVAMATYERLKLYVQPTDSEHRGYYEAAKQGNLVVQHCTECGLLRGSIGAACPFCTSLQWDWHPVSGKGVIYSYQIVTQAVHPAFYDWIPYPIVLVELDEQRAVPWRGASEDEFVSLRIVANLVRADDPTGVLPRRRRHHGAPAVSLERRASGSHAVAGTRAGVTHGPPRWPGHRDPPMVSAWGQNAIGSSGPASVITRLGCAIVIRLAEICSRIGSRSVYGSHGLSRKVRTPSRPSPCCTWFVVLTRTTCGGKS
ncbi:MAG: hypothetical protein E6G39_03900 [Actinobacteria bacterium]|nr:MAG: hypothetical protein E6G39_03900 [Actinomycetota bacterium]